MTTWGSIGPRRKDAELDPEAQEIRNSIQRCADEVASWSPEKLEGAEATWPEFNPPCRYDYVVSTQPDSAVEKVELPEYREAAAINVALQVGLPSDLILNWMKNPNNVALYPNNKNIAKWAIAEAELQAAREEISTLKTLCAK